MHFPRANISCVLKKFYNEFTLTSAVSDTINGAQMINGAYMAGLADFFSRFMKDERAATAIEYGLIAAGIAVAIIAVVQGLGSQLDATFSGIAGALE